MYSSSGPAGAGAGAGAAAISASASAAAAGFSTSASSSAAAVSREINASDGAFLYQTVVAAQFLEDALLNGRLKDSDFNAEARKLWQQWRKIVEAKTLSPAALADFRSLNGLDDWTDLGWKMLTKPAPPAEGGAANDTFKIAQLTSTLALSMERLFSNNDEHNVMLAGAVSAFLGQVCALLSCLEVGGWRNKDDLLELDRYFREIARESEHRAVEVADRTRLADVIGRLHDDCCRPKFFE